MPSHSTGANNTPLGRTNPTMSSGRKPSSSSLLNPSYMSTDDDLANHGGGYDQKYDSKCDNYAKYEQSSYSGYQMGSGGPPSTSSNTSSSWKRGHEDSNDSDSNSAAADRKRKRRSRWGGDEKEKTFIPGMPTVLPANLTKEQQEAYLGKFLTLFLEQYSLLFVLCFYDCSRIANYLANQS